MTRSVVPVIGELCHEPVMQRHNQRGILRAVPNLRAIWQLGKHLSSVRSYLLQAIENIAERP